MGGRTEVVVAQRSEGGSDGRIGTPRRRAIGTTGGDKQGENFGMRTIVTADADTARASVPITADEAGSAISMSCLKDALRAAWRRAQRARRRRGCGTCPWIGWSRGESSRTRVRGREDVAMD